jgi:hypothetical protein
MRILLISLLGLSGIAHAVPTQMGHQGRVLDADGLPAEGPHTLDFHLYDAAEEGTMVWSELHDVDLINGYYSLVLGADELGNPLEDELLRDYELHLELTVGDDEPLSPRQALNAVPYARLSATATSVNGGPVNASEVSIGGALVIDSSGAWVGTTPTMSWSDLSDVPEDVDTVLSEDEVDAFSADNGYAMASDLAAVATSGSWSDLSGTPEDMDTVLSEDEVDAFCADNGYAIASDLAAVASTGSWSDLSDTPEDVDTVLSEDEVDAFCANNGYALTVDIPHAISAGAVGVQTQHFTESGSFVIPDGITSIIVYVTGGGGGGSNGETTELDFGAHNHLVATHNHDEGDHSHTAGAHTHIGENHSHSEITGTSCVTGSHGGTTCSPTTGTTGGATVTLSEGTGSSGIATSGTTSGASLTTDGTDVSGLSITISGGAGGAGGGMSAILSVSDSEACEIEIGVSGSVDETGQLTSIVCGETGVACEGGKSGSASGAAGADGGCTTDGTKLSEYKPSSSAPGGGGLGAQSTGATSGQTGSITIRY